MDWESERELNSAVAAHPLCVRRKVSGSIPTLGTFPSPSLPGGSDRKSPIRPRSGARCLAYISDRASRARLGDDVIYHVCVTRRDCRDLDAATPFFFSKRIKESVK